MGSSDADVVARVQGEVTRFLDGRRLTASRRGIVVAVSGGADSLCLLDALVQAMPQADRHLVVGHVDHQLRPESPGDAAHVRAVAAGYGLPCEVLTVDVPALAAAEGRGIEEAARLGRYRALRGVAERHQALGVATGHTRDDLIETVLLHAVRGSGRRGLGGIPGDERLSPGALGEQRVDTVPAALRVVRPLLGITRADTVAYCQAKGIPWRVDASNTDPSFLRNRVRGHLLPVLRTYNPAIGDALDRLARVMRDEERLLAELTMQHYRELARADGERVSFELAGWRHLAVAVQRRLARLVANRAGADDIGYEAVERALRVGAADGPRRAELGGGLSVERRAGSLIFASSRGGFDAARGDDD